MTETCACCGERPATVAISVPGDGQAFSCCAWRARAQHESRCVTRGAESGRRGGESHDKSAGLVGRRAECINTAEDRAQTALRALPSERLRSLKWIGPHDGWGRLVAQFGRRGEPL